MAQTSQEGAPISQPLVREGTLAVKLVESLKLGTTTSEVEAESLLVAAGIAPYNGWIADYPVTPDIAGELRNAVSDATDAKTLAMGKDEALQAFDGTIRGYGLSVQSDISGAASDNTSGEDYADNTVINNYYSDEGPPVVTYYSPPPDYAYLYTWVPYPFWWWDFWFPGFFILVDFDRVIIVDRHHERHFNHISNHFLDNKANTFVRVDAANRLKRGTSWNVGATRVVGPSTVQKGAGTVFSNNATKTEATKWSRISGQSSGSASSYTGTTSVAPYGGERTLNVPAAGGKHSESSGGGKNTGRAVVHGSSRFNGTFGSGAGGFRGAFEGHHGR